MDKSKQVGFICLGVRKLVNLFGFFLLLSLCFFQITLSHGAQYWAKTYGGSAWDKFTSIQQTMEGGYIVAGRSSSFGTAHHDTWVVKLDANGNISWEKWYDSNGLSEAPYYSTDNG